MVSKKIIKYAVAFQRNREFGYALGDGEGTNPMYASELAEGYRELAMKRAGLSPNLFLGMFRNLIYGKLMDDMLLERERRRELRGIKELILTEQARATRIKQARYRSQN